MTQEHTKYEREVIYGTMYDRYKDIYIQQTRLCGARLCSPQLRSAGGGGGGGGGGAPSLEREKLLRTLVQQGSEG